MITVCIISEDIIWFLTQYALWKSQSIFTTFVTTYLRQSFSSLSTEVPPHGRGTSVLQGSQLVTQGTTELNLCHLCLIFNINPNAVVTSINILFQKWHLTFLAMSKTLGKSIRFLSRGSADLYTHTNARARTHTHPKNWHQSLWNTQHGFWVLPLKKLLKAQLLASELNTYWL